MNVLMCLNVLISSYILYHYDKVVASNLTAGDFVRQTKVRFPYQPGKSHLVMNNGPIRFVINNNNWKDYNINPFKIKDFKSVKSPDITQLSDKILKVSEINLATYNNVEKILSGNVLKYYFTGQCFSRLEVSSSQLLRGAFKILAHSSAVKFSHFLVGST